MAKLLSFVVVVGALFLGTAFYMGWFAVTPVGASLDGKTTNYNVSINKGKFEHDVEKGKEEVKQVFGAATTPTPTPDPAPTVPPPSVPTPSTPGLDAPKPNAAPVEPVPSPTPSVSEAAVR